MASDPRLDAYVDLFRRGEYFEAHEVLEGLWNDRDGDPFLQGLIIFAAAYVKVRRGQAAGAAKHFRAARRYLRAYPARREGFDVAAIAAHAGRCAALLGAGAGTGDIPAYPMERADEPPPPPPEPAGDAEVRRVLAEVAAGRAAGEEQAPTLVKEALLRLRGRAGRSRVVAVARAMRRP